MQEVDIVLLFETTGLAAEPFEDMGLKVACVDLNSPAEKTGRLSITADVLEIEDDLAELAAGCKLLFGFPPCDDLAVSGALRFAGKREKDPAFQDKALHLVRSVERIGERAGVPWALENPVGVISTLWRKPDFKFHPCDYGGYLPEDDEHPYWPYHIAPRDAYTKKTCLWTGNGFRMPPPKPVTPEPGLPRQMMRLGGKTALTKKVRAASPRGFFTALAQLIQLP